MRKEVLILFILLIPFTLAIEEKKLFDKTITIGSQVSIDGYTYSTETTEEGMVLLLSSKILHFIVQNNSCTKEYNLKACWTLGDPYFPPKYTTGHLSVYDHSCKKIYSINNTPYCTLGYGKLCKTDKECYTESCTHNLCLPDSPYCGDGICDNDEDDLCKDCSSKAIKANDSYTIPSNKIWVKVDYLNNALYNISLKKDYSFNNIDSKSYDNYSTCNISRGKIIGKLNNGPCFDFEEITSISGPGTLYLGLNDNIYIDNIGNFTVSLLQNEILLPEVIETQNITANESKNNSPDISTPKSSSQPSQETSKVSSQNNDETEVKDNSTSQKFSENKILMYGGITIIVIFLLLILLKTRKKDEIQDLIKESKIAENQEQEDQNEE